MKQSWRTGWQILTRMGPGWVAYRVRRGLENRLRLSERRLPIRTWKDFHPQHVCGLSEDVIAAAMRNRPPLNVDWPGLRSWTADEPKRVTQELSRAVQELRQGRLSCFSSSVAETGWPPRWHCSPVGPGEMPRVHFSRIPIFGSEDIKNFWECGRFGFVLLLARAWCRGAADDAPDLFWKAVEDFAEQNPPNCGVQYVCGQETAIRTMLLLVGWTAFGRSEASTDKRMALLWSLLAAGAERISGDISYALSQKNNHGISEAAGLLVIGLTLTEHPQSENWVRRGRRLLEQQLAELVYDDGGFAQHSANYHRVMMQAVTFAAAVAAHRRKDLAALRQTLQRAAGFLWDIMDRSTGQVPRYGHDDGAHILPWAEGGYDDFRPALQDALAVSDADWRLPAGPWDEGTFWLGAADATAATRVAGSGGTAVPPSESGLSVRPQGGMAVLRRESIMVCLRVPRPVHRTAHLDTLHVDIRWRGNPVALDPGTYRYHASGIWNGIPLARDAAHNVAGAPGAAQAQQVGRFLFLPWPRAELVATSDDHVTAAYVGSIGPIQQWRRTVCLPADGVCCVADRLRVRGGCCSELRWHLADWCGQVLENGCRRTLDMPHGTFTMLLQVRGAELCGADWQRGDSNSVRGWYAPRYGRLEPCHDGVFQVRGTHPAFLTVFCDREVSVADIEDGWVVTVDGKEYRIPD